MKYRPIFTWTSDANYALIHLCVICLKSMPKSDAFMYKLQKLCIFRTICSNFCILSSWKNLVEKVHGVIARNFFPCMSTIKCLDFKRDWRKNCFNRDHLAWYPLFTPYFNFYCKCKIFLSSFLKCHFYILFKLN